MPVLHQIIAVEKSTKSRTLSAITEIHKANQHAALFEGFVKTYSPLDDKGETYPQEQQIVQRIASESLKQAAKQLSDLFNITATKDWANCRAVADLVVEGRVLVKDAPVTFLLFLEKQLIDIRTMITATPTLDPAQEWTKDVNSYRWKTEPIRTHRTKKVQKPITLAAATDKHPAQTQMITEDEVVGHWNNVRYSGALPIPRKDVLLERVEKLIKAVKFARESANSVDAPEQNVADSIFGYLLAD